MSKDMKLLATILDGQDSSTVTGVFTEERIRSALAGRPPLTIEERRLIWMSPDARHHFLDVRRQVRREASDRLREADLGYSEHRLVAAGGSDDMQEVAGKGFTVMIFRDGLPGEEWSITCQLAPAYLEVLPLRTVVTLRDTGGVTWASDVPDDQGRIGSVWTHPAESPGARLARWTLWLEP